MIDEIYPTNATHYRIHFKAIVPGFYFWADREDCNYCKEKDICLKNLDPAAEKCFEPGYLDYFKEFKTLDELKAFKEETYKDIEDQVLILQGRAIERRTQLINQ